MPEGAQVMGQTQTCLDELILRFAWTMRRGAKTAQRATENEAQDFKIVDFILLTGGIAATQPIKQHEAALDIRKKSILHLGFQISRGQQAKRSKEQ